MKRSDKSLAPQENIVPENQDGVITLTEAKSYDDFLKALTLELDPRTVHQHYIVRAVAGYHHEISRITVLSNLVGRYDAANLLFQKLSYTLEENQALAGDVIAGNWGNILSNAKVDPEFVMNVRNYLNIDSFALSIFKMQRECNHAVAHLHQMIEKLLNNYWLPQSIEDKKDISRLKADKLRLQKQALEHKNQQLQLKSEALTAKTEEAPVNAPKTKSQERIEREYALQQMFNKQK
jgi:hypothetical protein